MMLLPNALRSVLAATSLMIALGYGLPAGIAQIVGPNVYLQGNFHEAGINQCGALASSVLPTVSGPVGPYHPGFGLTGISMVSDPAEDGWSTGLPPYCGDYAIPGSPVEGWSITCGPGYAANHRVNSDQNCSPFEIPGSITSYADYGSVRAAIWEGSFTWPSTSRSVSITQITNVPINDKYVLFEVIICNTGSEVIHNFYYGRNIDPDNDQPWSGDFSTINTIIKQPPVDNGALVEARGITYGCYLGLGAADERARVSFGNFATGNPYHMWNGLVGYNNSGSNTEDEAVSLAFKIDSLVPGQCDTLRYAYILDEDDLPAALDALSAGAFFETVCDESTAPSGQSHVNLPTKVQLNWDAPFGSVGCQIQARQVPSGPRPKANIFTPPYNSIEIPYALLPPGSDWVWRVKCLCNLSPLEQTPFTPYGDMFSIPALRQEAGQDNSALRLYPNPAEAVVTVEWHAEKSGQDVLVVWDMLGRDVLRQALSSGEGLNVHSLDVSGLNTGMYLIQIGQQAAQVLEIGR